MRRTSLRRALPAMAMLAGLNAGASFAQQAGAWENVPEQKKAQADARINAAPVYFQFHDDSSDPAMRMQADSGAQRQPSRLVCEQAAATPAAQWRCRPNDAPAER